MVGVGNASRDERTNERGSTVPVTLVIVENGLVVVDRGADVGFTLAAAAETMPAPRVGSGTSPLTCHPNVELGQAGGLSLGVYADSATPVGLMFFHCLARLS